MTTLVDYLSLPDFEFFLRGVVCHIQFSTAKPQLDHYGVWSWCVSDCLEGVVGPCNALCV